MVHGIKDIQQHEFFSSINWEDIQTKKVISPFIPEILEGDVNINPDDYECCFLREHDNNIDHSIFGNEFVPNDLLKL